MDNPDCVNCGDSRLACAAQGWRGIRCCAKCDHVGDRVWLEQAEVVEATDKWFGVARHPIPYMKPGRYYLIPVVDNE